MSNTFYKPKNEYGHLLADVPYVDNAIAIEEAARIQGDNNLSESISNNRAEIDNAIEETNTKIDTFKTITVKHVNQDGTKFANINEYFTHVIATIDDIEQLKVELGRTIYIIEGTDDSNTWEEYVCQYPGMEVTTNEGLPVMIRLGAVDSIMATEKDPGSVRLVHNLYDKELDWSVFYEKNYEGVVTHKPVKGKAVAPCALKAFVDADIELDNRISAIEEELQGAAEEGKEGIQDSRLDRAEDSISNIEKVIGINGCCDPNGECCGVHNGECCDGECNIFCKINSINSRLDDNDENDRLLNTRVDELEAALQEETIARGDKDTELEEEIASIHTEITEHKGDFDKHINTFDTHVEEFNAHIEEFNTHVEEFNTHVTNYTEFKDNSEKLHSQIIKELHDEITNREAEDDDILFKATTHADTIVADEITNRNNAILADHLLITEEIKTAKSEAIAYADEKDEQRDAITLAASKDYADIKISNALLEAKAYADEKDEQRDAAVLAEAKEYAEDEDAKVSADAKAYTDSETVRTLQNVDDKITAASTTINGLIGQSLSAAKEYSDNKLNIAVSDINTNIGVMSKETLDDAKAYTDSTAATLRTEIEAAKDAAVESATVAATENAKSYTDSAINNAINDEKAYVDSRVDTIKSEVGLTLTEINSTVAANKASTDALIASSIATEVGERNNAINSAVTDALIESKAYTDTKVAAESEKHIKDYNDATNRITTNEEDIRELKLIADSLGGKVEISSASTNIHAKIKLTGGQKEISYEKLLGSIDTNANNWIITLGAAYIFDGLSYAAGTLIYPEVSYKNALTPDASITITFGTADVYLYVVFNAINTTQNSIIVVE